MKGILIGTFLLVAILTLVISGVFFVVLSNQSINTKISLKSSEILKSVEVVEAVKIGLDIAYNYSFFQAAYEIGKMGGYENEESKKEWRVYEATYFPSFYIENVKKKTENYIYEYLQSLEEMVDEFKFSQPSARLFYPDEEGKAKMIVSFSNLFTYSKDFFTIYENSTRVVYIPLEYFKLYDTGYRLYIEEDEIRKIIEEAEEKMDLDCRIVRFDEICEQNKKDKEEILNERCPNADEKFKEMVLLEVETPKSNEVNIRIYVDEVKTQHKSSESYEDLRESPDCGCKRSIFVCEEEDEEGNCTRWTSVCVEYYKKYYNLVYTYGYFGALKAKVNITTKSYYPVYDSKEGNTKLRKLTLKFDVITSNDYNWKPL